MVWNKSHFEVEVCVCVFLLMFPMFIPIIRRGFGRFCFPMCIPVISGDLVEVYPMLISIIGRDLVVVFSHVYLIIGGDLVVFILC